MASSRLRLSPSARRPFKFIRIHYLPQCGATPGASTDIIISSMVASDDVLPQHVVGLQFGDKVDAHASPSTIVFKISICRTNHEALATSAASWQPCVLQTYATMASGPPGTFHCANLCIAMANLFTALLLKLSDLLCATTCNLLLNYLRARMLQHHRHGHMSKLHANDDDVNWHSHAASNTTAPQSPTGDTTLLL